MWFSWMTSLHSEFSLPACLWHFWCSFDGGYMSHTKQATSGHTVETNYIQLNESILQHGGHVSVVFSNIRLLMRFSRTCAKKPQMIDPQWRLMLPLAASGHVASFAARVPWWWRSSKSLIPAHLSSLSVCLQFHNCWFPWSHCEWAPDATYQSQLGSSSESQPQRPSIPPSSMGTVLVTVILHWEGTLHSQHSVTWIHHLLSVLYALLHVKRERGNVVKNGPRQEREEML